ncbi:MAG TPA: NnrU family protein, partial [Sphingorhabdus sp.]|nr:NnrU family protein [Sphingorhabdus sp.]
MGQYSMLGLACLAFVGTHFLMSHPLRRQMVWRLGAGGFSLVYSGISLALFYWMVVEFGRAPKAEPLWPAGDVL